MIGQTDYQSKYFANFITLQNPNWGTERIGSSLLNATIDMNPHQIEWALFYFNNPISKWVLLADEVWLWKTIEAWLVMSQLWSETSRKIILIVPAALRKQRKWELDEKFFLPNIIIDGKIYKEMKREWIMNPFEQKNKIVITSYQFAAKHESELVKINWDLLVIDEAHNMRNVYQNSTWIAARIRTAFKQTKKLLLTATPLQNNVQELYWLVSFIDDYTFWDLDSFRKQFSSPDEFQLEDLKNRMKPLMHRILRSQVREYIRYTERIPATYTFNPSDKEVELYNRLSTFLQKEDIKIISPQTQHLIILILRRLLASSSYAIAWTLEKMINKAISEVSFHEIFDEDIIEEYDELTDDAEEEQELNSNIKQMKEELAELEYIRDLAKSIQLDAKTKVLESALNISFENLEKIWANRKALIFTWFKRTQEYLVKYLEEIGYKWKIVTFNGSNNDARSKQIYYDWIKKNEWTSKISWVPTADMRAALVDYFRDEADIMIATESAAEWVNLQFCSLIINYDLPRNPQRIEQRIWRCHRYGQTHDVTVLNFINERNYADQRVFELLSEKFSLFKWLFDASDKILWSLNDWVDFEQKIFQIYQKCRTKEQIDLAFKELEEELKPEINKKRDEVKKKVLENFNQQVISILKNIELDWIAKLWTYKEMFWNLSKNLLPYSAIFNEDIFTIKLFETPAPDIPLWTYTIDKALTTNYYFHRPEWPLWRYLIDKAKNFQLNPWEITFYPDEYHSKVIHLKKKKWLSWWLRVDKLYIDSFSHEEYLLLTCIDDNGEILDPEIASKLLLMPAEKNEGITVPDNKDKDLEEGYKKLYEATINESMDRNNDLLIQQRAKLQAYWNDKKLALQKDIDDMNKELNDLEIKIIKEKDKDIKIELMKQSSKLWESIMKKQQDFFTLSQSLIRDTNNLIRDLESRKDAWNHAEHLFTIRWNIK